MNTRTDERQSRKEATRRRRKDRGGVIGQRLGVTESKLDFNNFSYRWINDAPARMIAKTQEDDWDIVHQDGKEIADANDLGSAVSQVVGTHADGSPMRAYLCRKPKAWYDEDQTEKVKMLDSQLSELRRGNSRDGSAQSDYVPNEGIRI